MGNGARRWWAAAAVGVAVASACSGDDPSSAGTTVAPQASDPTAAVTIDRAAAASTPALAPTVASSETPVTTGAATVGSPKPAECAVPDRDPGDPIAVRMLVNVDDRTRPAFEGWERDFESAHPGVDIVLDPVDVGSSALATAQASHPDDRPAVVHAPDLSTGAAIQSGIFEPVAGCGFRTDQIAPAALANYVVNGLAWAAPLAVSVPVLYYGRDLFDAAGLDPDRPPTTVDELAETARALVASGVTDVGLVLDTSTSAGGSWYVEQFAAQLGLPTLLPDNGRGAQSATSVAWNEPEVVRVLTTLRQLVVDGVAVVVPDQAMAAAAGYADLLMLDSGDDRAAMAIHTSGSLGPVLDQIALERVGIAPMPLVTAGAAPAAPGGAALWLTAGLADDVAIAARQWISYLMSAEVQGQLAAENGYAVATPDALGTDVFTAAASRAPQLLVPSGSVDGRSTDPGHLLPVDASWPELRAVLATAVHAILVDGADPTAALTVAEDEAETILARSG